MRNGKRFFVAVLAAAMGITSVVMPADDVWAAGNVDETTVGMTEEEEKAIAGADGVESFSGKYIRR